jgi:hypothetical protein
LRRLLADFTNKSKTVDRELREVQSRDRKKPDDKSEDSSAGKEMTEYRTQKINPSIYVL